MSTERTRTSETPAAIIESATTTEHRQILGTVGTLAKQADDAGVQAPAMLVIGAVAAYSSQLAWFESARLAAAQ